MYPGPPGHRLFLSVAAEQLDRRLGPKLEIGRVELADGLPATAQSLLSDPQTSGGLLVSCAAEAVAEVLDVFGAEGFGQATVVGRVEAGRPGLRVEV